MAHPFFDAVIYPWHREDARELHVALWQAIPLANRIIGFYQSCGPGLLPLANGGPDDMWTQALNALTTARLLDVLGDRLAGQQGLEAVNEKFELIRGAQYPDPPPVLSANCIFLNRINLRARLEEASRRDSGLKVILVRGESTSGKTWSQHLIENQVLARGETCIYLCNGIVGTVLDAMDLIFAVLGGQVPDRLSTEDAWFRKACTDMIRLAQQRERRFWIVADDLGVRDGAPRLDPLIRQFFDQMALSMLNPAFSQWFRLILIDYPDGDVPTRWRGFWKEDRTAVADVDEQVVSKFLIQWADWQTKQLAEADASSLAQGILAKADSAAAEQPPRPRLEKIHDELLQVLETL